MLPRHRLHWRTRGHRNWWHAGKQPGFRLLSSVATASKSVDEIGCDEFRRSAFNAAQPLLMKGGAWDDSRQGRSPPGVSSVFSLIPRWFGINQTTHCYQATARLRQFSDVLFPYELLRGRTSTESTAEDPDYATEQFSSWLSDRRQALFGSLAGPLRQTLESPGPQGQETQLLRFYMPLSLLLAALEYNARHNQHKMKRLYIAQAPLNELPPDLRGDVLVPEVVRSAGKGDVYDSSVWLGLEPTYTPWHRDPNPNLFCQLYSSKVVRLLPPTAGEQVFRAVQTRLGRSGNSRIRGEEMMQGPEREALHDATWGRDAITDIQAARLEAGDALFIPKGWWHSVKSELDEGGLNGSVNWWFR